MSTPELDAYDKAESALRALHAWLGEQLRQADYADEVVKLRHTKAGVWLAVKEIWRLRDEAHHARPANVCPVEWAGQPKRNAPLVLGSTAAGRFSEQRGPARNE